MSNDLSRRLRTLEQSQPAEMSVGAIILCGMDRTDPIAIQDGRGWRLDREPGEDAKAFRGRAADQWKADVGNVPLPLLSEVYA